MTNRALLSCLVFRKKTLVDNLFEHVIKEEAENIPSAIEELSAKGVNFTFAAETLIGHTRNLLMQLMTGKDSKELTSKENEYYRELAKITGEHKLYALFQVFQKLLNDLKFFNFEQYIFEFAMYKAANIASVISTKAISTGAAAPAKSVTAKKPMAESSSKPTLSSTDLEMQSIISALESANHASISSMLGHGYIVHITDGTLTIGFSSEKKFYFDFLNRAQNNQILNQIIPAAFEKIQNVKTILEQDTKKKSIVEKKTNH